MAAGELQALQAHLARAQEAADKQTVQCQQEVAAAQRERSSLAAELAASEARNQQLSGQLLQFKGHLQELQQGRVSDASAQERGHQAAAGGGVDAAARQQLVRPEGDYTHAFAELAACSYRLTDAPAGCGGPSRLSAGALGSCSLKHQAFGACLGVGTCLSACRRS